MVQCDFTLLPSSDPPRQPSRFFLPGRSSPELIYYFARLSLLVSFLLFRFVFTLRWGGLCVTLCHSQAQDPSFRMNLHLDVHFTEAGSGLGVPCNVLSHKGI
jgi:hypothetical protein